jgi:putative membrane protein
MAEARRFTASLAVGVILALYALARVLELVATPVPRTAVVALDVLAALAFALVDGARHYRVRGVLVFAGICALIGETSENLSVATGFPFGRYGFLELMGPKLFQVPILLGLAYIGMAYVSWMVARIILADHSAPISWFRVLILPLVAAFIMVPWDLAQDPVWGTILRAWKWYDGGPWFGVPVSNYFGWYLTVFLIYLAFAMYLRRWPPSSPEVHRSTWWPPVIFYALCASGNVLQMFARSAPEVVQDSTGRLWRSGDIMAASALVSVFVMGAFAVIAAVRLIEGRASARG